ncbi:MAG: TIGR03617 family F420-dependent LLM class oxidoreductase [Anaerolineales bacterium]|nr:TIGR03617 family F420-dependent LLM class oxidoreductase [Anaerolineales bacterium]
MVLDAALAAESLSAASGLARAAEAAGFAAVWTTETQHSPFLPLPLIAEHTTQLRFGTAVAIGLARSPLTLAHTAWDLAEQSGGRFILGLGTQVKAHIERRFGMAWPESPVGKLRELIEAIRAVWRAWQTGERLNYRGEYYQLTLMTPFFSPPPHAHSEVPIYLAGVNTGLARLAGEVGQGYHVHPLHSADYLRAVVRPALAAGAARAAVARTLADLQVAGSVLAVTRPGDEPFVRQQIAFYASTPSYRPVLALHGWEGVGEALSARAARGDWAAMPALVSDAMLEAFAVSGPLAKLAEPLRARYAGLLDRVTLYRPYAPGDDEAGWRTLAQTLAATDTERL